MSLLTMLKRVANELGLAEPSAITAATASQAAVQLKNITYRTGEELRQQILWPQLTKEHTFTLTTDVASYALPGDFDRVVFDTHWGRSELWPLIGPLTPQEWQSRVSGVNTAAPRQQYRIKGCTDTQFFIHPTPSASDDGNTIVFEYQSSQWMAPATWATGTVYGANSYSFYNGNIYKTTSGGTSGATPPTHTTGDASDDTVTWTYQTTPYETFTADSDQFLISESMIGLGVQWRYMRQKGLPYSHIFDDFNRRVVRQASAFKSADKLNLSHGTGGAVFLSSDNVPDTGYGS